MVSERLQAGGPDVYSLSIFPKSPTLDNFRYVFTELPFPRYMLNSFFVSATVTVIALFFHSMAAYALARLRFPGRELIFRLIFATLLVSLPVILVPLFVLVRAMGMLNTYAGLIIPAIFHAFGIFLLRQFYLGIPESWRKRPSSTARATGGSTLNIILPLSRPILAALAVFFFLANWNSFLWPLTITTDQDLWVVQTGIASFQPAIRLGPAIHHGRIRSWSPCRRWLLFFIFQRQLVESIKTSGFK